MRDNKDSQKAQQPLADKPEGRNLGNLVPEKPQERALTRNNFIMMAACGLLIVIGFSLMAGAATTTDSFNPDIFSTQRIVVGPTICFVGFVLMAFAILYRRRSQAQE